MVERTMEELEAELDLLKKQNLERKIARERADAEDAEQLRKKEAEDKLRDELRNEEREKLIKEMDGKSKIEEDNETKTNEPLMLTPNETQKVRDFYAKTTLDKIPATPAVRVVFDEDTAYFRKAVERDSWQLNKDHKDRSISGRSYEDLVRGMSQSWVKPKVKEAK